MGCLIKIKTNDGYLFFNNRESAEAFINKKLQSGELSFSEFDEEFPENPDTKTRPAEHGQKIIEITKRGKNSVPREILKLAANRSKELTRRVQDLMYSEDMHAKSTWDTEEFNDKSNIIGVGKLLQQLRRDGDKRLFPEFISKNYQNTLIIKEILKYSGVYKSSELDTKCSDIAALLEFSSEENVLSSQEWTDKIISAIKEDDSELAQILSAYKTDDFSTIQEHVHSTLQSNILQLFKGEIFHKLFEVFKDKSPGNHGMVYNKIIKELKKRYEECGEIKQVFGSIDECFNKVTNLFMTPNAAEKTLFSKYCYIANQVYTDIEKQFSVAYPGAKIEILHEARVTLKIDDLGVQNTCFGNKEYVQGKLDIIVLVNGVAHIVDLKTIKDADALNSEGVKFAKTKYTMGMYKRMLERAGLSVGNLYLYDVVTAEDDISQGRLTRISDNVSGDATVQGVLDGVMKRIVYPRTDIKILPQQYIDRQTELFGEQVSKSKKGFDVKSLKDQIKVREERNGSTSLVYTMLNDKGKEEQKKQILAEDANVEDEMYKIAEKMLLNREKYEVARFTYIKNTLRDIINGSASISALYAYQSSDYEARYWGATLAKYKNAKGIIEVEGLDDLGIILVETDSGVDVLCVTTADIYSSWDTNNSNKKLFDHIGIASNLDCTVGTVNLVKAALVANDIIKNLDIEVKKVNTVKVLQTDRYRNYYLPNTTLQKTMETVCSHLKIDDYLQRNMSDPFIVALCEIASFYSSELGQKETRKWGKKLINYSSKKLSVGSESITVESFKDIADEIHSVMEQSSILSKTSKIAFLRGVEEALLTQYPAEFSSDPTKTPTTLSEVHMLRAVIDRALNSLLNKETMIDRDVSKFGWNNGVMWNSIDMVGVKIASDIRTLVEQGNSKITKNYSRYQTSMRGAVKAYHESVGYTGAKKYLGGHVAPIYSRLFRKDDQNNYLNNDLILRNPWDPKEELSTEDRNFLKFVLFTLNKYKYGWKSMEQMSENKLMENDYLFPLCRHQTSLDKYIDPDGSFRLPSWRALVEDSINKVNDISNNSKKTYDAQNEAAEVLSEVYNEYAFRTDKSVREELISTYGINNFTVDIHTALNIFVVAMESANIYNEEVLPAIKSIQYTAMFDEIESGVPIENTKEFIKKYLTSAIYGSPLYKGEVKEYMKIAAPLLGAASSLALSWNLINLPRERIMGMFSIISKAAFASYGQNTFGIKNYIRAWAVMGWDVKDFIHSVTKIELLNEHFRITNMTINELPQQTTSSRTGLWQTFDRWMGWTLIAPDYWNRMTMFIAQMMEDGCWDAYSVIETENGPELKYDMSKDARFEVLCRYGGNIDSVPEKFKTQYLQQQALYEIKREELNETSDSDDRITQAISSSNKDWYLTTAYTTKERNSLKSFSDTTFGYYDRDTKAWLYKTAIGVLFKQFMAYASSKKVQYFKTRTDQTDRGEYAQLTTNSGERIWKIIISDDAGKAIPLNVKESELDSKYSEYKNSAKPVYIWKGAFVEGIVNSYWNLLTETVKAGKLYFYDGDLESKQKAKEIVQTIKEQYGKRGDIRHSNVLQGLYDLWISIGLMWLIRLIFFDDPAISGESYKTQLKNSDPLFKLGYSILTQATSDFNIGSLLYNQVFEWRMPSLSIIQNTGKSFWRALGDDSLTWYEGLGKGVISSAGIFKPFKPFADTYFEDVK